MREYPEEIRGIVKKVLIDFTPCQLGLYTALKNLWVYKSRNKNRMNKNVENQN